MTRLCHGHGGSNTEVVTCDLLLLRSKVKSKKTERFQISEEGVNDPCENTPLKFDVK